MDPCYKATFKNELGNTIGITITRSPAGSIRVVVSGPSSVADHTYTREEVMQLIAGLFEIV